MFRSTVFSSESPTPEERRTGPEPSVGQSGVGSQRVAMVGCTAVARNYLGYARVLADSWTRVHPGAPFSVLVLDGSDPELDVVAPEHLGLDPLELQVLRGIYGPLELATALKPHLLARLLDGPTDAVVFLDPDTEVYAPLDDVGLAAAEHGVALSPHVLAPVPVDGFSPTEMEIHQTGIFNAGLIAVGRSAWPFLHWWAARVARDCVIDPGEGLFVDQRILDRVPACFTHTVLRDPSLNVAYWNLHERPVTLAGARYEINGALLRHFHFSGFDPMRPRVLTTYEPEYAHPLRVRVERTPCLQSLCADYAARVRAAGHLNARRTPYAYARTASGRRLGKWERAVYREAVLDSERGRGPFPPSPFDPEQADSFAALIDAACAGPTFRLRVRARLEKLLVRVSDRRRRGSPAWPAGRALYKALLPLRPLIRRSGRVLMGLLAADSDRSAHAGRARRGS